MPPVKNTFLMEARTVKADAKFITRDTAQQVGSTQRDSLVKTSKAEMHLEGSGVSVSSSEEEHDKEVVKSFI